MYHAYAQDLAKPPFMHICRKFEKWHDLRALSGKFCDKNLAIRKVLAFCDSVDKARRVRVISCIHRLKQRCV